MAEMWGPCKDNDINIHRIYALEGLLQVSACKAQNGEYGGVHIKNLGFDPPQLRIAGGPLVLLPMLSCLCQSQLGADNGDRICSSMPADRGGET